MWPITFQLVHVHKRYVRVGQNAPQVLLEQVKLARTHMKDTTCAREVFTGARRHIKKIILYVPLGAS